MGSEERSFWRDKNYSLWHRKLGEDLPWQDIDVLTYEYDNFEPTALIELKAKGAGLLDFYSPQAKAHRNLANRADIPFFVVNYTNDLRRFVVRPFNKLAFDVIIKTRVFDAEDYVRFLYLLRKKAVPQEILDNCEQEAARIVATQYCE